MSLSMYCNKQRTTTNNLHTVEPAHEHQSTCMQSYFLAYRIKPGNAPNVALLITTKTHEYKFLQPVFSLFIHQTQRRTYCKSIASCSTSFFLLELTNGEIKESSYLCTSSTHNLLRGFQIVQVSMNQFLLMHTLYHCQYSNRCLSSKAEYKVCGTNEKWINRVSLHMLHVLVEQNPVV